MRTRDLAILAFLAMVVFFTSVYEDAEDVFGIDATLYPQSEALIHGFGAIILILAFVLAYRLGRSSK